MKNNQQQYTVAVRPIQQQPGSWFATYIVSLYENGRERVLESRALRESLHGTEAKAKDAARRAGELAISRLLGHFQTTPVGG